MQSKPVTAEIPCDKEEGDELSGPPHAMEISEASLELLPTDKLPYVFSSSHSEENTQVCSLQD